MKNKLYIYINNLYRQVYIDLKNTIFMETANEKTEKVERIERKIREYVPGDLMDMILYKVLDDLTEGSPMDRYDYIQELEKLKEKLKNEGEI